MELEKCSKNAKELVRQQRFAQYELLSESTSHYFTDNAETKEVRQEIQSSSGTELKSQMRVYQSQILSMQYVNLLQQARK